MKIKCPDCRTSYEIKAEAIGGEGRSVKCAKCGNRWFVSSKPESEAAEDEDWAAVEDDNVEQDDPGEATAEADEAAWEADSEAEADDSADEEPPAATAKAKAKPAAIEPPDDDGDDDDAPQDPSKADIETLAKRPKIKVNPNKFRTNRIGRALEWMARRNYRRIGGIVLFGSAVAVCAFLVVFRDNVVKQAPDLASLFQMIGFDVNLRGLEFRDLRTFSEIEDGKQVLVVEGSIRNVLQQTNMVPAVRLSIRGSDLQEMYAWTVEPKTRALNGFDETRFRTILADPPDGATDIQVRFVDRGTRRVALE